MTEADAYKIAGKILDVATVKIETHHSQQLADRIVAVLIWLTWEQYATQEVIKKLLRDN